LLAGEEGVRLSLAGAQDKLPVYVEDDQVFLPIGTYPSSHILKTPIRDLIGTVENEAFCMAFAAHLGVSVPAARVRRGRDTLYLVERFDRQRDAHGRLARRHQEDFCQALGVPPDMKYEKEGGPSIKQCAQLIRQQSARPAADLKALLGWVIFNCLIGNADAHGKNLSLLLGPEGATLAPFYDLLCTAVYPGLTERLAMRIGGEERPERVIHEHWAALAADLDIKSKLVFSTLEEMAVSASDATTMFTFSDETGIVRGIRKIITDRSRMTLARLAPH
jgi:serine/threonine-protein kinase HipA